MNLLNRRQLLQASAATAGVAAFAGIAQAAALSFRYAYSAISWGTNIEEAVRAGERLGYPGIEPFSNNVSRYRDRPLALKKFMDDHNVKMVTCSGGGDFLDLNKIDQTVKDNVALAREFIEPFGYCNVFKLNMGPRPPGYDTNDEQIKRCAAAMNRIGKETSKMGLRTAPHPHVNSLVQTQREVDVLMQETDPEYVWMTADLGHLVLGGLLPMEVLTTYWSRIAHIHYKGAPTKLKNSRVVGVPRSGEEAGGHGWFRSMSGPDSGGVDFPAVQKYLVEKKYSGWATLDYDQSMIAPGSTMEALLTADKKYIIDVLKADPKADFYRL